MSSPRVTAALWCVLLVLTLVLSSCAPGLVAMETGPRAWVGGPPDASEVPLGPISVMCHGYADGGVAHLELWVNGAFVDRAANTNPGAEYFTASISFETTGPGPYVVHCRTYDEGGEMVQSEPVTLTVPGEEPTPTEEVEIPTATPTSTEVPPTETVPPPTETSVPPTATTVPPTSTPIPPTSTPIPPTSTPEPPRIVSFEVTDSQIVSGECVTFSWEVAGFPTAIYFDGEGVGNPDSRQRCPTSTKEFELRAEGPSGTDTERLTVVVVSGDTTGPSIGRWGLSPTLINWNQNDNCSSREATINAYNVTDPSGVSGVKVIYRMTGGTWQSKGMTQAQTASYSATIGPNDLELSLNPPVAPTYGQQNSLEYYVQAIDDLGNTTNSQVRTATVQYCVIVT
jgi:hypothetical protein